MADLQIWFENPVLGVGPGGAYRVRQSLFGHHTAAHTEFSRLLAEHGILGFLAILLLLVMAKRSIGQGRTNGDKAFAASMIGWSLLYMGINAMRIVAPSFLFGLPFARIEEEEGSVPQSPERSDRRQEPSMGTPLSGLFGDRIARQK
jgi:hypothetical protein